jgi:hypothetical protein
VAFDSKLFVFAIDLSKIRRILATVEVCSCLPGQHRPSAPECSMGSDEGKLHILSGVWIFGKLSQKPFRRTGSGLFFPTFEGECARSDHRVGSDHRF